MLARRRHPAGPNSLDALCARYQIDLSRRALHGALLDAELLAEVYIELIGGRQASLTLGDAMEGASLVVATRSEIQIAPRPEPRPFRVTAEGDGGTSGCASRSSGRMRSGSIISPGRAPVPAAVIGVALSQPVTSRRPEYREPPP
jgi:hypothetical protein